MAIFGKKSKALEKLKAEIEDAIIAFEKDRTQAKKDYAFSLVNKLYGMEEYYVYFERINNTLSYEEENAIKRKEIICNIVITLGVCYLGYGFYLIYKFYNKNDKEYKSAFDNKYYRDFPASYGPEIVEYLIKKNVTEDSFSASLVNLIYKKNIGYESIDKKDYKLTLLSEDNLTTAEKRLVLCVFDNDKEMTLKKLKKNAKSSYDSFIRRYNTWKDEVIYEATNYVVKSEDINDYIKKIKDNKIRITATSKLQFPVISLIRLILFLIFCIRL